MTVYLVTNKVDGKVYIGQTITSLSSRWGAHLSFAKHGRGGAGTIGEAIRRFGPGNFKVTVLWLAKSRSELDAMEALHIKIYRAANPAKGYNQTADGRMLRTFPWLASPTASVTGGRRTRYALTKKRGHVEYERFI